MKRFLSIFITILGLQLASIAHAEVIRDFAVEAELAADRTLTVTEKITYDFEDEEHHGIIRLIPERYKSDNASYRLRLEVLDADMDGNAVSMKVSREGANTNIRLGDPDVLVSGKHVYTIRYRTERAINDFPGEHERELYWNVTGNEWLIPIDRASFRLVGPAPASQATCFTGRFGSSVQDCTIAQSGIITSIQSDRALDSGEGLTVALRFPEEAIAPLTIWDRLRMLLADNIWLALPILVFIIMYAIWHVRGRDPKGRGTVIAQYEEPRGLKPAQMTALQEDHVSHQAVSATILDLARRGFIKIHWSGDAGATGWFKAKPSFTLNKTKPADESLLPFERQIHDGLFGIGDSIDVSARNEGFWKAIQQARNEIFSDLKQRKFIESHPATTRAVWSTLAIGVAVVAYLLSDAIGGLFILSGLISAAIIGGFGWLMPRATFEGAVVREEIEGLKLFLSVTEKDRLAFHNAPEKRPEQFERFLPAALALGVEEQWAGYFQDMQMQPPSYMDGTASNWNALRFAHAMDSFNDESSSHMYQSPSSAGSGGSGFSGGGSGGGFGGGGGGSW